MKRMLIACLFSASALLAACASPSADNTGSTGPVARNRPGPAHVVTITDAAGAVAVQRVEFKAGASSTTVERMAKNAGCEGGQGAGRVTEKGPVEIYRMQCGNGGIFMARCELRQCRPL